jgi:crotonobetainyl-CoA:carnitine CoA-transferase CaiB-like acyl-CoA transferase
MTELSSGILASIRVVDLASGQAGSVAALLLAEAGAEVVKAEAEGRGFPRDDARHAVWNRSKQSVAVHLSAGEGRARLDQLLAGADVLIHDLTPGEAAGHDLAEADLGVRFPNLIVCAVGGYPAGHALQDMPVDDLLVLGEAGVLDEQGAVLREGPVYLRFPLGSWQAAYLAATGVLARLFAAGRGALRGPVRTSLLQGSLVTTQFFWARAENDDPGLHTGPKRSLYSLCKCADGVWIHLMSPPDHVPAMKAGMEALSAEEAARALADRPPPRNIPNLHLNAMVFATRASTEWLPELWANDVAVMPAVPWGRLFDDEQAHANDLIVTVDDPELGRTRQPGPPMHVTPPLAVRSPAPRLDEHDADLLERWGSRSTGAGADDRAMALPLAGLKVLDFGNFLAGPLAPSLMADLGADVIKVEQPSGDPMRWSAPWAYMAANRNKRSLALQLKNPGARSVLEALIRQADVVHHNLRMPAATRLGLDYESLKAINPKLVYCHVSAYGARGPRRDWPGFDQLFQAASGWEYEGAGENNPPMWHRFGMMDHLCAAGSLMAMLLALLRRDQTGEGQAVSASLLGAAVFSLGETVMLPDGRTSPFPRLDSLQLGVSPQRRLYKCADGWVALAAEADGVYPRLLQASGAADVMALERHFAGLTVEAALALGRSSGADVVHARQNQRDVFLDHPAHLESRLSVDLPHPQYGAFRQPGAFWDFGNLRTRLDSAAPALGQHTVEILTGLGLSEREIGAFVTAGVVA